MEYVRLGVKEDRSGLTGDPITVLLQCMSVVDRSRFLLTNLDSGLRGGTRPSRSVRFCHKLEYAQHLSMITRPLSMVLVRQLQGILHVGKDA